MERVKFGSTNKAIERDSLVIYEKLAVSIFNTWGPLTALDIRLVYEFLLKYTDRHSLRALVDFGLLEMLTITEQRLRYSTGGAPEKPNPVNGTTTDDETCHQ